jgi:hypothetical protein
MTSLPKRVRKKYPNDRVVVEYVSSMKQEQIYSEHDLDGLRLLL